MSNLLPLWRLGARLVVIFVLLTGSPGVYGQCALLRGDPSTLAGRKIPGQPVLPESAYLSNTTYTNVFFGFGIDLPISSLGHLVKLPLTPKRQHALLALAYQKGDRSGSLTVDAIEPHEGLEGFSDKLQQQTLKSQAPGVTPGTQSDSQLQINPNGALIAPAPRIEAMQFQYPAERFRSSERRNGEKHIVTYWTQIKNYRIGVLITTNDKDFLQKARQTMSGVRFYCTAGDGTLAGKDGRLVSPDGELYEGPAVPTWRADVAIQSEVALAIPPGKLADGTYRNPDLGVEYEVPDGWEVLPAHNSGNPSSDLREFEFLHACSRTLLRVQHAASGDTAASDYPAMIILRALDPVCLSMRIPVRSSDIRIAEEVGVSLETLLEFGQVSSHELVSIRGQLFMIFRGTIAAPSGGDSLPQRMSQVMFATSHNKFLMIWSFMAPTAAQLATIPTSSIRFDGSEAIDLKPALNTK